MLKYNQQQSVLSQLNELVQLKELLVPLRLMVVVDQNKNKL